MPGVISLFWPQTSHIRPLPADQKKGQPLFSEGVPFIFPVMGS